MDPFSLMFVMLTPISLRFLYAEGAQDGCQRVTNRDASDLFEDPASDSEVRAGHDESLCIYDLVESKVHLLRCEDLVMPYCGLVELGMTCAEACVEVH